jgi:hypothetical protein
MMRSSSITMLLQERIYPRPAIAANARSSRGMSGPKGGVEDLGTAGSLEGVEPLAHLAGRARPRERSQRVAVEQRHVAFTHAHEVVIVHREVTRRLGHALDGGAPFGPSG